MGTPCERQTVVAQVWTENEFYIIKEKAANNQVTYALKCSIIPFVKKVF
ncbi:hypothetical protein EZS27_024334 [termite gut metagenome]|uniref:Uncharacterized protein n=1 Tax=termite gut metagenome TaxID=433724 RepID=A0A5J4QZP3_9ZZZZ